MCYLSALAWAYKCQSDTTRGALQSDPLEGLASLNYSQTNQVDARSKVEVQRGSSIFPQAYGMAFVGLVLFRICLLPVR